jgi:hypothetical protein
LWAAYDEHWRRFCAARLDPSFWRLDHPAQRTGAIAIDDAAPVVIVGAGPSLRTVMPRLAAARDRLHLITSPRGCDALAGEGLVPDLVLIEHQTPLDAMFSISDLAHRPLRAMARVPLVAATANTPDALLDDISLGALFVPDPLPSWGLWPATAAAMAIAAGARSIGLAGVDLGTYDHPDPAHAPLRRLLELIASHGRAVCFDAGLGGAAKRGWEQSARALDGDGPARPLSLAARPWTTIDERRGRASACAQRLAPLVAHAHATLQAAGRVRDGDRSAVTEVARLFAVLLASGQDPAVRLDLQEGLGVSFLPRYWRTPPDPAIGAGLWRAAAMSAHEIVRQHGALVEALAIREEKVS